MELDVTNFILKGMCITYYSHMTHLCKLFCVLPIIYKTG